MNVTIDSDSWAARYRNRILNKRSRTIFVSSFVGTGQEVDLSKPPNCAGLGRIRHFTSSSNNAWPSNPLPLSPASNALGTSLDSVRAQVFQNAACNWRCWYCYVPFEMLSAHPKYGVWKTSSELVDLFLAEEDHPLILVLSGGQPELTPEWILWTMYALEERQVTDKVYLWSDDNLSNDYFWKFLTDDEQEYILSYRNYGKVGCFKGFDEDSFAYNTLAATNLFQRQFEIMKRYVASGFDIFAYVTLTTPKKATIKFAVKHFIDRLQSIHTNMPLRTVPLEIKPFSPVVPRITVLHNESLINQHYAVEAWKDELLKRFTSEELNTPITDVSLK